MNTRRWGGRGKKEERERKKILVKSEKRKQVDEGKRKKTIRKKGRNEDKIHREAERAKRVKRGMRKGREMKTAEVTPKIDSR